MEKRHSPKREGRRMRIEENWDDCYVYSVIIEYTLRIGEHRVIKSPRMFVFRQEKTDAELKELIHRTFGPFVEAEIVDSSDLGHLSKESCS